MSGQSDRGVLSPEDQVEILRQRLASSQRLATLGELLSTVAHDLNNVLMPIINYAQLGLRHADAETREKALHKIQAAGQRAAKITAGVLGIARSGRSRMEAVDVAALVRDTLTILERDLAKHRIELQLDLQPAPDALANAGQIQQVLVNLLINARQAMPRGGSIVIRVTSATDPAAVDLSIRDSGVGIPAEQLPKIFDPFFTTKDPDRSGQGGTGVGLSSCREIIEGHQGRIRVASTPGKGTEFTIRLPAAASVAAVGPILTSTNDPTSAATA